MSKGSQPAGATTSTQSAAPYMYPYIGTGLSQAGNIYGATSGNPAASVAPFNPVQEQQFGNTQGLNTALAGNVGGYNPATQTGQLASNLSSSGASNPYLNQMFTQAAQAVQPQLASQFAGSGRNITGSLPLASQQLNNLASSLYGSQYNNNVQNALQANQLYGNQYNQNISNLMNSNQQLGGVGSQIQGQSQNLINAPYTQLSQYSGALGGFQPGQATSNPYFSNSAANTLGTGLGALSLYNGFSGSGGGKGSKGGNVAPTGGGAAGAQANI